MGILFLLEFFVWGLLLEVGFSFLCGLLEILVLFREVFVCLLLFIVDEFIREFLIFGFELEWIDSILEMRCKFYLV